MTAPSYESVPNPAPVRHPVHGVLPSLDGATGWLNSPPLTERRLQGKVVLVNFWTYTCINWLRQLPYLRAWAAKYAEDDLIVVGVHTPEFGFEADVDNVSRAVREMKIEYPVAIDSEYSLWSAFGNRYWPALYFADADGLLRQSYFGEGQYQMSEATIQQLLSETSAIAVGADLGTVDVETAGAEEPADWDNLMSPETYTGYLGSRGFASPGGMSLGARQNYSAPARLKLNDWALAGRWTMTEQAATLNATNGSIFYRFHARDLHLVMGPARRGTATWFRVRIDGLPPRSAAGSDIDEQGYGEATGQRLYQLVRQTGPITDHTFEITFLDPEIEVYAFTFG
jgi:thiol-disulfide isomerase/thioredoxin